LALAAVAASAPAVHAQSMFERLLGSRTPPLSEPSPGDAITATPTTVEPLTPYESESDAAYSDPGDEAERTLSKVGSYRTMCVRMCDGFYWPVSSSANRGKFFSDAKLCQASCDMEARLFYLPRSSDDIAAMRDLTGRVYGRLPTVFAYRKAVDSACLCKPEPWSEAEALRHRAYGTLSAKKGQTPAISAEASSMSADSAARRRYTPRAAYSAP
jgi:hypothetical protein